MVSIKLTVAQSMHANFVNIFWYRIVIKLV